MNPFKPGDVVYHPQFGKVVVEDAYNNEGTRILLPVEFHAGLGTHQWVNMHVLSFEPWPPAVTVRPWLKGYYLAKFKDYRRTYLAYYDYAGLWSLVDPDGTLRDDYTAGEVNRGKITPLAYLGPKIEGFPNR